MRYSVQMIDREFAPREAAAISKVSTALQRDWRRREIMAERQTSGWSSFTLSDVILMTGIKMLSECGFQLSDARLISTLTQLPVFSYLSGFEDNYEFEGLELSPSEMSRIRDGHVRGGSGCRYLKVPLPAEGTVLAGVTRSDDLRDFSTPVDNCAHFLVIDNQLIGDRIMQAVKGPLFRVEVEEITEE